MGGNIRMTWCIGIEVISFVQRSKEFRRMCAQNGCVRYLCRFSPGDGEISLGAKCVDRIAYASGTLRMSRAPVLSTTLVGNDFHLGISLAGLMVTASVRNSI
jgi:hypothetical protein